MDDNLFDEKVLKEFKKDHLVMLVLEMQKEKTLLSKMMHDSIEAVKKKVVELERSHLLYLQYGRRESVEISGIPAHVKDEDLEKEVIKVYDEAGVKVFGRSVNHMDISACHRLGKKGETTIVRFVNRKFAREGLFKGKNLKGTKLYGETRVFINNSFCHEYKQFGWIIRQLKKNSLIEGYKVRNGVHQIKVLGGVKFVDISHVTDFSTFNLDVSSYLD